nr:acyltransferase [Alistipes onderdonkii]
MVEPGLYLVNGKKYIEIGDYCLIGRNSHITAHEMPQYSAPVKISIGDGCMFGSDMHITAVNSIRIGKNVRTGKSVLISDNSHGDPEDMALRNIAPNARPIYSKGAIVIGDNVWIGEKAAILAGVTIGEGAIIGANAVVTKNIPPYSIAAGIPTRIIK